MLNIIAMEILINDVLSNVSFYNIENNYANHFFAFIFVCVLNLIQIAIKLKEKEDIHTWDGEDGEKREI